MVLYDKTTITNYQFSIFKQISKNSKMVYAYGYGLLAAPAVAYTPVVPVVRTAVVAPVLNTWLW